MKKQLRNAVVLAAAAAMTVASVMTASAATWKQDAKGWWVENEDGTYLTNQWYQSPGSGLWYYMGNDGYMLTNATTPDGFFVNAEGIWDQNPIGSNQSSATLVASDFIILGDSDLSWYNNSFLDYCKEEISLWGFYCYDQSVPIVTSRGITFGNSKADVINVYGNPAQAFSGVTVENDGIYRYYTQVIAAGAAYPQYYEEERHWASLLGQLSCIHYALDNEFGIRFYFDQNDQVACIAYFKNIEMMNYD